MKVPFLDLKAQYQNIRNEIDDAVLEVLASSAYTLGPYVEKFENNFAGFTGVKHCIGVNSGTSALHLALLALGVKPGDEVITTPHTFVATVWAISYTGAKPVFVDINPETYTIDPGAIREKITNKTKVIIPVHLYGQATDMAPMIEIARENNLRVLEDAAQAHGTMYDGKNCGSIGDASIFSFYPGKNLGAYGEAGAVCTNNDNIAHEVKLLRNHYQPEKYIHEKVGYNYRMEGLQGAILNVKLKHIKDWNNSRRRIAHRYSNAFKDIPGLRSPLEPEYSWHIYHLYELGLPTPEKRNEMLDYLKDNDIFCGLHYPIPVHLQKAYSWMGHKKGDFPSTEIAAETLISLPVFPEMSDEMVDFVIKKVKEFAGKF